MDIVSMYCVFVGTFILEFGENRESYYLSVKGHWSYFAKRSLLTGAKIQQ